MGTKSIGDEQIRKLQKTGQDGDSYMLTIPKSYIKELGWREHQKVIVTLEGQELKITDWSE